MSKKKQKTDIVVDARDCQQIANLADWCRTNLAKDEWDYVVMNMFPLWIRFKFHCPKQHIMALLNT